MSATEKACNLHKKYLCRQVCDVLDGMIDYCNHSMSDQSAFKVDKFMKARACMSYRDIGEEVSPIT